MQACKLTCVFCYQYVSQIAVADPGFSGGANPRGGALTYYMAYFSPKTAPSFRIFPLEFKIHINHVWFISINFKNQNTKCHILFQ